VLLPPLDTSCSKDAWPLLQDDEIPLKSLDLATCATILTKLISGKLGIAACANCAVATMNPPPSLVTTARRGGLCTATHYYNNKKPRRGDPLTAKASENDLASFTGATCWGRANLKSVQDMTSWHRYAMC
jgi:hypothetical protein